ncbi:SIR2 family protein [Kitasatospora sp. NPDC127111]|uniref:SIR2 family protein n=1 Tax=Kitasatospora sp. NPDC127111 TaxID=3345363 RepID=UPI00362880BC
MALTDEVTPGVASVALEGGRGTSLPASGAAMNAIFDNREFEILKSLGRESDDHFGVLIGAGASIPAGLPNWPTLVARLLHLSGIAEDESSARQMLSGQDILLATEVAIHSSSNPKEMLYRAIYNTTSPTEAMGIFDPAASHYELARLAVDRTPSQVSLLTLNVDDLLEDAIESILGSGSYYARDSASPRARPDMYEIHHLHGLISRDATRISQRAIFTLSDYNRLLRSRTSWQLGAFQECLQRGPLLLYGTSYGDIEIRCWLDELYVGGKSGLQNVYTILSRQGLSLTIEQFKRAKEFIRRKWPGAIFVDSHGDAVQALREIRSIGDQAYKPPASRIANHWQVVMRNFSDWQASDVQNLENDLATKLSHWAGSAAALSLWIVDGGGMLVQWAVSGTVHTCSSALRRVQISHESSWVECESLCSERISVKPDIPRVGNMRWKSIAACPVFGAFPGGPELAVGAISLASEERIEDQDVDGLAYAMADLANHWRYRLEDRFHSAEM